MLHTSQAHVVGAVRSVDQTSMCFFANRYVIIPIKYHVLNSLVRVMIYHNEYYFFYGVHYHGIITTPYILYLRRHYSTTTTNIIQAYQTSLYD